MKLNLLIGAAIAALATATSALADWRKDYPTVVFGLAAGENLNDQQRRWAPFIAYLSKELGVEVEFRNSLEYAPIIEGMNAGLVHMANLGAASYATAYFVTDGNVEAFATNARNDGSLGYHSMVVVRADSGIESLEDLKGKKFAFNEPNSTSGYIAPSHFFRQAGMMEDGWFAETAFAGGDEAAMLAVMNGTYDATATWYNSDDNNNVTVIEGKGFVEPGTLSIAWVSPLLPSGPWTYLADLPDDMKADIKAALVGIKANDPAAFESMSAGNYGDVVEADHAMYQDVIAMRKAVIEAQKNN